MAKFIQLNKLNTIITPKINVNKVLPIYYIFKRNDIKPKKKF